MSGLAYAPPRAARENRLPGLAAALALHAAVLALVLLAPSKPAVSSIGASVPVNIVSSAPTTDTPLSVQAPQTVQAAAPQPVPQAPPQAPAPPLPTPQFSPNSAQPPKAQKVAPPQQPALHGAPPTAQAFDLDKLQRIIASHQSAAAAPASSAPKGQLRQQTAPAPSPDAGHGVSQSDITGLEQLLDRLWNPNCEVAGGDQVKLRVTFVVTTTGHLLGQPDVGGLEHSSDPVVAAAALRARDAVREVEPYAAPYYGQSITVNFDAKEACAKR